MGKTISPSRFLNLTYFVSAFSGGYNEAARMPSIPMKKAARLAFLANP